MEKMPFNGIGIVVALDREAWVQGKQVPENLLGWHVMGPQVFQLEDFRPAMEDLEAPKWSTFTENFLAVSLSSPISAPGFTWFDDERWHIIANNFAVMAAIAAKARCKGLILDPEHYSYQLFSFEDQRKIVDKPFEEYAQIARQRGRDVMSAVSNHLPDAIIFSLSAYSVLLHHLGENRSLHALSYALLPAFYDGLLQGMSAASYLVDGYESAYGYKQRRQFTEAYQRIRQEAIKLSAFPERYREKVKVGFGLWLDNKRQANYFQPQEFRQALGDALDITDRYVWLYSQGPRFFPVSALEPTYIDAISGALRGLKR